MADLWPAVAPLPCGAGGSFLRRVPRVDLDRRFPPAVQPKDTRRPCTLQGLLLDFVSGTARAPRPVRLAAPRAAAEQARVAGLPRRHPPTRQGSHQPCVASRAITRIFWLLRLQLHATQRSDHGSSIPPCRMPRPVRAADGRQPRLFGAWAPVARCAPRPTPTTTTTAPRLASPSRTAKPT